VFRFVLESGHPIRAPVSTHAGYIDQPSNSWTGIAEIDVLQAADVDVSRSVFLRAHILRIGMHAAGPAEPVLDDMIVEGVSAQSARVHPPKTGDQRALLKWLEQARSD
jgi:hypothetical protein